MSLDRRLRRASQEVAEALSGRRGAPIGESIRHHRTMRIVGAGAAAVFVFVAVGATAWALRGPASSPRPPIGGAATTTTLSRSTTTTPRPSTTTTSLAATTTVTSTAPEDTGLAGGDLLPEAWREGLEDGAEIILMEDGIGVAVSMASEPDPIGEYPTLTIGSGPAIKAMHLLGTEYVAYELPELVVGFAVGEDTSDVTVFGVVPLGSAIVELQWPTGSPPVFDRVFARPEVDRAVFIGTMQASGLVERAPGPIVVALTSSVGTVTRFEVEYQSSRVSDTYTGPITGDLFRVPSPLVVETRSVDTEPNVIACDAPDGTTPPPNQGGTVTDLGIFPSPDDALAAFLAEPVGDPPIADSGYVELVMPDGAILYGVDYGGGFVTLIHAIPADGGWTIDRWEGSGC